MSEKKSAAAGPGPRAVLLRRAGIAGAMILALLVGLNWFEREQTQPEHPPMAEAPPPPPLPELPHGAPPMPTAAAVEEMVAAEAGLAKGSEQASAEMTAAPVIVEPDRRVDETPPAVTGSPRLVLGGDSAAPAEKPAAPPPPPPVVTPHATKPVPAPAPMKNAYLVQLGVFSAPGNAQALADKLDALGIPAHIESRVVVGPFKNRAEADAAQKRLKASGLGKGMVVRGQ